MKSSTYYVGVALLVIFAAIGVGVTLFMAWDRLAETEVKTIKKFDNEPSICFIIEITKDTAEIKSARCKEKE